ncbi:MAG: hypothetical protein JOS17DRAFT_495435 [Linnemannia elongata]|nr:MAG: hypothetical protein JOS17DRAFT_495435 [Linnemannia elongata]
MTTSKDVLPGIDCPSTPSRFVELEQATKNWHLSSIKKNDPMVPNELRAIQSGSIGVHVPQDHLGGTTLIAIDPSVKDLPLLPPIISQSPSSPFSVESDANGDLPNSNLVTLQPTSSPSTAASKAAAPGPLAAGSVDRISIFLQNVAAHSLQVPLPVPGARLESSIQLGYCNQLIRTHLSPLSANPSIAASLDPSHQASIDFILQDNEEQNKIRELTRSVVEEFVVDTFKTTEKILEVILLGPFLDQEYYRKLLNCLISEFEKAMLMDINLLQGLVKLVQCAGPDYLQPDDLVRILAILRTRLQDTHKQTTKHHYYLTLALSRILDVMVVGNVQDLKRVVDHEPLSVLLGQLMESPDLYLKHQATYALQGLLYIPNDETQRHFVLRHAGNIVMGLLEVASVCNLNLSGFSDGVEKLRDATVSTLKIGRKAASGIQSIYESGQGIAANGQGGILSGRRIWYAALREAQEHIQNGRLADFNRLVFEAPCQRDFEFQWGVCQLLGEIAVDSQWDTTTRHHATDLLVELYRNDNIRNPNKEICLWILTILRQIVALPDTTISDHTQLLLQGLENEADVDKQTLYRAVMDAPVRPFPLRAHPPLPSSSPLLIRVLAIPDVEYDLHRLRAQRLEGWENALYIPPQAKPTLQSTDETLFPLMEKAQEFLAGSGHVFLLLGDSGGGKSTFNRQLEHSLWKEYKRGGPIPLHINLPSIDNPQQDMITKQLQHLNFLDDQIQELKLHRQFIIICDGYDESQLKRNLYATNSLNQPWQWRAKMVISCRSQYLGSDHRSQFQPLGDRYQKTAADLFQEAVIAPFSRSQIEQYVEQFVQKAHSKAIDTTQPRWTVKEYMEKLAMIPNMIELVSNPFLLTMALQALPKIVRSEQDLSKIRLTRVGLYDNFIEQWLETSKMRLEGSTLSLEAQETLEALYDDGFVQQGIDFQKDLASAIFINQEGAPVVTYSPIRERNSWKASFFSLDSLPTLLRESSLLTRSGNQHRFLHRSILEYLYSGVMSDPLDPLQLPAHSAPSTSVSVASFVDHPLNQRSIVSEPPIVQFLAERVELDPSFKARLYAAIEESKVNAGVSQAAANAISILVRAGTRFNGADLRGIRIPGADIHNGQFDSADLEGADLSGGILTKAWFRQANLSKAMMSGVQFGELSYLEMDGPARRCVFSSDGSLLAVSTESVEITVYDTATWASLANYPGGYAIAISPTTRELARFVGYSEVIVGDILTGDIRIILVGHETVVNSISYSPDGTLIATGSMDTTIRIWSTESGYTLHILSSHTEGVNGVSFSRSGHQLASCSNDNTIRTWDAQTGESLLELVASGEPILSVAYSPDDCQIVVADSDRSVMVWDAHTGTFTRSLVGHAQEVYCVTYSPDGNHIASCGRDLYVRLWDAHNGEICGVLPGHRSAVSSVSYSPDGRCIASASMDGTVRLWDVERALQSGESDDTLHAWQCVDISLDGTWIVAGNYDGTVQLWETLTGKEGVAMKSHTRGVLEVAFSSCGERVVSGSRDCTVRLWCVRTGSLIHVLKGHTARVRDVAFSPSGHQVASAGQDETVRIWDTETGEPGLVLEGHTGEISEVAYSPSGHQIASCSTDKTVRLWCTSTGEQLMVLGHWRIPERLVYSSDEQEIMSITPGDGVLYCCESKSGELVDHLALEDHEIVCFCSSPCGKLTATVGKDGTLRIWDRASAGWLEVFRASVGFYIGIFWVQGLHGMYLTTCALSQVRVWELEKSREDSYNLRQLWSLGKNELSLSDANLRGAVGLSPVDLKLVIQRGAITESKSESMTTNDGAHEE